MTVYDPRKLDVTVRQGGRLQEGLYYEAHRLAGVKVRMRYRPDGQGGKAVKNMADGQGRIARHANRVSWKRGTGEGTKKSAAHHRRDA